jgi:hypothetical protein
VYGGPNFQPKIITENYGYLLTESGDFIDQE